MPTLLFWHKVRRTKFAYLEDTNGDGKFDKSTVFADKMTFPQGIVWHDGSIYASSPPDFWRLTDTNGDGVADKREVLLTGFPFRGMSDDMHGGSLVAMDDCISLSEDFSTIFSGQVGPCFTRDTIRSLCDADRMARSSKSSPVRWATRWAWRSATREIVLRAARLASMLDGKRDSLESLRRRRRLSSARPTARRS